MLLMSENIPEDLKWQVLSDWEHVCDNDVDPGFNPVEQMVVTVSGDDGAVFIETVGDLESEGVRGGAGLHWCVPGTNILIQNQLVLGLQSGLLALW